MKFKSLIITVLCAASVMCFSAEFNYSGVAVKDLAEYTRSHRNEIKTFADIKKLVAEYKAKYPTVKTTDFTAVNVAYLTIARTNKIVFQETFAECEKLKSNTSTYWFAKFHTIYFGGKSHLTNTEYFTGIAECLVKGKLKLGNQYVLRAINTLIQNDLDIDKETKIKYYQQIFEKYYVTLADTSNKEYNTTKLVLSKIGLKLKSLGVDVK